MEDCPAEPARPNTRSFPQLTRANRTFVQVVGNILVDPGGDIGRR